MAINNRIVPLFRGLQMPAILLILSGCTYGSSGDDATARRNSESARIHLCQKELEGLKTVVPEEYQKYRDEFDRLMHGAAQYAGLRTMVGGSTRHTVDALYQYKVSLLCAGISQRMLTGLAERGEHA